MSENEKTPISAATLTEAAEKSLRASSSDTYYTTSAGERQLLFVEALLPQGEANAIRTRELVALTGYRTARALQAEIEAERRRGALILSSVRNGGGYFLPADGEQGREEISAFVRTLDARARKTQLALRSARRALRECEGQTEVC